MDTYIPPIASNTLSTTSCNTASSIHHIRLALLEKRAVLANDLIVDKETGEILGEYIRAPASHTLARPLPHRAPDECRSEDEWDDYIEKNVDRRKLPPHTKTSLLDEQDAALGLYHRDKVDCRISKPAMALLLELHGLVKYRNVVIMTQAALAKRLGVCVSNLTKTLAKLVESNRLRVLTSRNSDMRTGDIKLLINPRLVFRGHETWRDSAVQNWYRPDGDYLLTRPEHQALLAA